jgi:hypothetical protein
VVSDSAANSVAGACKQFSPTQLMVISIYGTPLVLRAPLANPQTAFKQPATKRASGGSQPGRPAVLLFRNLGVRGSCGQGRHAAQGMTKRALELTS